MDITLLALLVISMILFGLHMPYAVLTMVLIIALATVATRLSWSVLSAFESIEIDS